MAAAYVHRLVDPLIDELVAHTPGLTIVGPRACGKTTTAMRRARTVVDLDAPAQAAAFQADPDSALADLPEPVLLDEWQVVPGVFGAARRAIDADPSPGRFLLAGSVLAAHDSAVWPGTGRFLNVPMFPLTVRERMGRAAGKPFLDQLADGDELRVPSETPDLRGYVGLTLESGFPAAALQLPEALRMRWLESYLRDLFTHDLGEPDSASRLPDRERLRRYFEAYALNSAGVAEYRTIAEAAGIAKQTATSYESLLERLFIVERLPAWTSNRLKRLVRMPKRYVVDSALMAAVLRLDVSAVMADGDLLGRMIDTFVAAQIRPELAVASSAPRLYHLRTEAGRHEVDLIAEFGGGRVVGIEIKATASPSIHDARHLAWLRGELGDRFASGVILHSGPRAYPLDERIVAAPISTIWS